MDVLNFFALTLCAMLAGLPAALLCFLAGASLPTQGEPAADDQVVKRKTTAEVFAVLDASLARGSL
jgi:hypothetical protein